MRLPSAAMIVAITGTATALAVCESTDTCLRVIEESQRATQTLSARFEQTKHISLLAEPLVTRGQFAFRQPDQFLWRVSDPPITVRIDRDGIHLPEIPEAKAEVAALAPFSAMIRQLSSLFSGSLTAVRDTFEVKAEADGGAILVHLVPRQAQWQHTFRSIAMSFIGPPWVVTTIHIEEPLGDSLDIAFSDTHRNDAAANAAFDAAPHLHE
jgi:hypothetical protein